MDPAEFVQNLSVDELEIEYLVRGLNSKAKDATQMLLERLVAEMSNKSMMPKNTHAKNPDQELEECKVKYFDLHRITLEHGATPTIEFLTAARAKTIHYKCRTERLGSTLGETALFQSVSSNWRRALNWCNKLWSDLVIRATKASDPANEKVHSPPILKSSSFYEKIDNLIDTQFNTVGNNMSSKEANTSPTVNRRNDNQPNFSFGEANNLKNSVADFFAQVGVHHQSRNNPASNTHSFSEPQIPTEFGNSRRPFPGTEAYAGRHANVPATDNFRPAASFRVDDSYKLKQKWNLLFDGGDAINVHDFLFRLEQMAYVDDFPRNNLTKILHLFLSKKAEDWFWVFKADHPYADWTSMKSAILSYFSTSNYEEEIKEQILRRYQGNRESFSDFSLNIQKMNARLQTRLTEQQIVYRLCQNMYPALKNVTLPYHSSMRTVEELRLLCKEYEKLWEQTGYDPRRFGEPQIRRRPHVNELNMEFQNLSVNRLPNNYSNENKCKNADEPILEAFQRRDSRKLDNDLENNDYYICWNCRDIGHRYQDCKEAFLKVFCFGCGAANVRKPNCQNCLQRQQGNQPPGANWVRGSHFGTNHKQMFESKDIDNSRPAK